MEEVKVAFFLKGKKKEKQQHWAPSASPQRDIMKLLANCRPPGQRILALHPPEAVLFTHSAPVCGSPRKSFCWYLFALSVVAVFLEKKKKEKKEKERPVYLIISTALL